MNALQSESEYLAELQEKERSAWANGDTEKAELLARLCDDVDELTRLRALYWALCDQFPIHSGARKADILEKVSAIWDAIENAGEVQDA